MEERTGQLADASQQILNQNDEIQSLRDQLDAANQTIIQQEDNIEQLNDKIKQLMDSGNQSEA